MNQDLIFGQSQCFKKLLHTAAKYATSEWPVLIQGETGVGKELLARKIHSESKRSRGPFVAINCGALTPGLFESELFGHERGAFTGALQSNRGLYRQAHGGTIFLDEVGELDLSLQVKLLRLIESGEVRSVGATRVEKLSVRIVAATNVDLDLAVSQGNFRQDLLERLSVLNVRIPPLRERTEDIPLIADYWLNQLNTTATEESLTLLQQFHWPGNIRQLRNVLVRASILSESSIPTALVAQLLREEQLRQATPYAQSLLQGSLAEIEKQVIVTKLKQCGGNRKRTAKELGIAKSTLHDKLRRWKTDHFPMYRAVAEH